MLRKPVKTLLGMTVGLLALPVIAACDTPTAQTPTQTPTATAPGVDQPPAVTPAEGTATDTTATRTIAEITSFDNSFSILNTAIEAAGLEDTLSGDGPYTVFAPTNEAFEAIPAATRERLLDPENRDALVQVLSYHVVPQDLPANQIEAGEVETISGQSLNVEVDSGAQSVNVNNARVIQPDVEASNGVIHVVDQVILPPGFTL
ncbi:MAG: fasciclin domain-containing protein [Cyanobacteria bacterium Co-bin13]|nr:fasciclin domain-containing protein [Cyanobacteria bacterium Co-bin13]